MPTLFLLAFASGVAAALAAVARPRHGARGGRRCGHAAGARRVVIVSGILQAPDIAAYCREVKARLARG
jgi:hypothetical protein